MRLLHIDDENRLSLVEFFGGDIPPYAILSHTWGPDSEEVTYRDMVESNNHHKRGYQKIHSCAWQAKKDNLRHFWVDTCCSSLPAPICLDKSTSTCLSAYSSLYTVDKSSSAELTESINSMFDFYKCAEVCYALLEDLADHVALEDGILECRWFTRGWTLQELLAPRDVQFYDQNWTFRGSRKDHTETISEMTRVPTKVLLQPGIMYGESVGARMSWAARRTTKRKEDMAYCLLGIFGINMPLIYGEGRKAFWRLQEEIIKRNNDLTIFAWGRPRSRDVDHIVGVFATSPVAFADSHALRNISVGLGPQFSVTNRGLLLTGDFQLYYRSPYQKTTDSSYVLYVATTDDSEIHSITLRKLAPHFYGRLRNPVQNEASDRFVYASTERIDEDTIFIATDFHHADDTSLLSAPRKDALHIPKQEDLTIFYTSPQSLWDHSDAVFLQPRKDFQYPFYSLVVAVQFIFRFQDRRIDSITVVYSGGFGPPDLHVFSSQSGTREQARDICRLFPSWREEESSLTEHRAKDIQWDDVKRIAPWLLKCGDSVDVQSPNGIRNVRFFVEYDDLDIHEVDVIPVTSLKAVVIDSDHRRIEDRRDSDSVDAHRSSDSRPTHLQRHPDS